MSNYEAKSHYKDEQVAQDYNAQYRSPLGLSNFRARLVGWGETRAFQKILRSVPANGSVLDVACGTGRYSKLLLDHGYTVTGIDISEHMLYYAREITKDYSNLRGFQVGDAANLPFDNNQFDGISCIRLYQRIPAEHRQIMLREVKRVARHWAILFFGMSSTWLNIRQALRQKIISGRPNNPNAITIAEMKNELEKAQLTLQDSTWVFPGLASGMIIRVSSDG